MAKDPMRPYIKHHPGNRSDWSACGAFQAYCTKARKPENIRADVNCKNCIALMDAGKKTKHYTPKVN